MPDWGSSLLCAAEVLFSSATLYLVADWLWHRSIVKGGSTNRWVLITGCDTGLGNAAAIRLDSLGCRVIAGCLTTEGQAALRQRGSSRLVPILLDITSDESVQAAYKTVSELIGPDEGLWGLVNNAGIVGTTAPVEWLRLEDLTLPFRVNTMGMIRVTQTFLPLLKRSRHGARIVNVASILGRITIPSAAPYAMSKHAIEALSDALRLELAPFNIAVSVVEPGGHPSNLGDKVESDLMAAWNRLPETTKQVYGSGYRDHALTTTHLNAIVVSKTFPGAMPQFQDAAMRALTICKNFQSSSESETYKSWSLKMEMSPEAPCNITKVKYLALDLFPRFAASTADPVVAAYEHALFRRRPRAHYLVGVDAKLMGNIGLGPTAILDFFLSLPGVKAVPAICKRL